VTSLIVKEFDEYENSIEEMKGLWMHLSVHEISHSFRLRKTLAHLLVKLLLRSL